MHIVFIKNTRTAQASAPRNRDGVVVASGLNLIAMELQLRPWPTISL